MVRQTSQSIATACGILNGAGIPTSVDGNGHLRLQPPRSILQPTAGQIAAKAGDILKSAGIPTSVDGNNQLSLHNQPQQIQQQFHNLPIASSQLPSSMYAESHARPTNHNPVNWEEGSGNVVIPQQSLNDSSRLHYVSALPPQSCGTPSTVGNGGIPNPGTGVSNSVVRFPAPGQSWQGFQTQQALGPQGYPVSSQSIRPHIPGTVAYPAAPQQAVAHPATTQQAVAHPAASQQAFAYPVAPQQAVAFPAVPQQAVAHPAAPQQAVAHPAAPQQAVAHPAASQQAFAYPAAPQQAVAYPAALQHAIAHPAAPQHQYSAFATRPQVRSHQGTPLYSVPPVHYTSADPLAMMRQ